LTELALTADEWKDLNQQHSRLANAVELTQSAQHAVDALSEMDGNCLSLLGLVQNRLSRLAGVDPRLAETLALLDSVDAELREVVYSLRDYASGLDEDPAELVRIETRIDQAMSLARKYRCQPQDLPEKLADWQQQLDQLEASADQAALAVAEQAAPAIQPLATAPLQAPAMATTTQTVAVAEPATQATQTLAIAPLQAPAAAPTTQAVALAEPATPAAAIAPLVASATQAAPQGLVVAEQAKPVRVAATERKVATRAVEAVASAQQANVANLHTVQGGDTLYNISRRYGMNVAQLQALNGLEDSRLQLGQTLKVSGTPIIGTPVSAEADAVSELASLTGGQPQREYIVQTGDTVYGIARKFGVHHTDIKRWNAAARLAALQPGQRLIVQGL